nr:M10 family metallopeptidase domain-containing protein [Secundilactobacillus similis]
MATHELGHALGLDHSTSKLSVMYPVDQSRTTLSTADLNALKAIYND